MFRFIFIYMNFKSSLNLCSTKLVGLFPIPPSPKTDLKYKLLSPIIHAEMLELNKPHDKSIKQ